MSTLVGHSLLQALQERQRSSDSLDLLVLPFVVEHLALHQLPQQMGAATGGVQLFAGGHEAGAHGSGVPLAAGADADAAQCRGGEGAVIFGEGEVRLRAARACSRRRGEGLRAAGADR